MEDTLEEKLRLDDKSPDENEDQSEAAFQSNNMNDGADFEYDEEEMNQLVAEGTRFKKILNPYFKAVTTNSQKYLGQIEYFLLI